MFYGVLLLLISGLGLWFVESIPWSLRWLRYTAVTVHVVAAMATIGGFIIHVYMGTAMVRGGFTSIIRGEVTADWRGPITGYGMSKSPKERPQKNRRINVN